MHQSCAELAVSGHLSSERDSPPKGCRRQPQKEKRWREATALRKSALIPRNYINRIVLVRQGFFDGGSVFDNPTNQGLPPECNLNNGLMGIAKVTSSRQRRCNLRSRRAFRPEVLSDSSSGTHKSYGRSKENDRDFFSPRGEPLEGGAVVACPRLYGRS